MACRCPSVFVSWNKDDMVTFVLGSVEVTLSIAFCSKECAAAEMFVVLMLGAEFVLLVNFLVSECISGVRKVTLVSC